MEVKWAWAPVRRLVRLLPEGPQGGGQPVAAEFVFADSYPPLPLFPGDPTVA